jgi:hypothetical protein
MSFRSNARCRIRASIDRITALDKNLKPVSKELEALQQQAGKASTLFDSTALARHRGEDEATGEGKQSAA